MRSRHDSLVEPIELRRVLANHHKSLEFTEIDTEVSLTRLIISKSIDAGAAAFDLEPAATQHTTFFPNSREPLGNREL
jgi:hypothetical protein